VLEGYLSRGWRGPQGMECLLGVGLGLSPSVASWKDAYADDDEFAHLDPDDCPSLREAAKILYPNLCRHASTGGQWKEKGLEGPEAKYEAEMSDRLAEFLTVPSSTPDLSTHFEDLAYKFPAEPVERAVVRFCEAVASWRGQPELENNKRKTAHAARASSSPNVAMMSVDLLVQTESGLGPNPTPKAPKSPIEKYFVAPPPMPPVTYTATKRRRSNTTSSAGAGKGSTAEPRLKKLHFETDEWTGPYGI